MSNWECSVCGYVHKEEAPPEKCPICDAPAKMFQEMAEKQPEKQPEKQEVVQPRAGAERRWRCTVCGYVHTGDEPPETCPVCDAPKNMFVEIDADGKTLGEPEIPPAEQVVSPLVGQGPKTSVSLFERFAGLSLKLHLHPMTVHFPNGILPAVLVFLCLSVYFNIIALDTAAYYNLIFVLVMLPLVLLTGFIEWQKRYKGARTAIFIMKITCSLIILALVSVLVFWRLLDPGVVAEGSPYRIIYLGTMAATLGVVGFAGHLGGKLLFGSRGN